MNADQVNRWLTLGANIGVVIGLLLLAVQIKQDADLTKVQLFSDHTNSRREWNQAMMGGDRMVVVAKSVERPHELTLAELQIMDMYLIGALNEIRRLEVLKAAGLDVGADVEGFQSFFFGSNFAKAWYEEYGGDDEFGDTDNKINNVDPGWLVKFFNRVLANLEDDAGQILERDKDAGEQ